MENSDQPLNSELISFNNDLARQAEEIIRQTRMPTSKMDPAYEKASKLAAEQMVTEQMANHFSEVLGIDINKEDLEQTLKLNRYAESQYISVAFSTQDTSVICIDLQLGEEAVVRAFAIEEFTDAPEYLRFPAIAIVIWSNKEQLDVTTPYGNLPSYAIDINDKLFYFRNVFFLNRYGQGIKFEEIFRVSERGQSLEDTLEDTRLQASNVPRLNIIMSPENNRYVPLNEADYNKISSYLDKIRAKELNQIR